MCHKATWRVLLATGCLLVLCSASVQAQDRTAQSEWSRLGGHSIELSLASLVSGPVDRVWYSPDGARLLVRTRSGRVFETSDFERWQAARAPEAPADVEPPAVVGRLPGGVRGIRATAASPIRLYAYGSQVYRSDDGGLTWSDQTTSNGESILGAAATDLTVSPSDPDEIAMANDLGIWRSLDGGASWTGLNDALPNLPVRRLLALPEESRGLRVLAEGFGALEWAPGEKHAWRPVPDPASMQEVVLRGALSARLGAAITAVALAGETAYAGAADGRLWVSLDGLRTWRLSRAAGGGPVEALFTDATNPRLALVAMGGEPGARVLRTLNGGLFWDDLSSNLPPAAVRGITAEAASGALYAATDRGVFFTRADLTAAGPASAWNPVGGGLPVARAMDVKLDLEGNRLFVAVEGYGVWAGLAPHRLGSFRLVNAADLSRRPAAPGSLVAVLGGPVRMARSGNLSFPVLASSETESQIQVPFEVRDRLISLALEGGAAATVVGLSLREVSPAVFVDRDGTPLVISAETGSLLDAMNPAWANSRVQILATGLGQVRPPWPTGLAAPAENPPEVVARVRAFLDGEPIEVTRAVLAPGYVGLYLIEAQLPALVNRGPAELWIQAEGQPSNRVRVYLEP
jgi:uncharacterized protein (TIGR03437 family)